MLPLLPSRRTSNTATQIAGAERVLAVPSASSSGVVPSFACPNLHDTTHTEAHRHRGRRSCAWSLETYRSRREPQSKAMATIAASSEADWNAMKMREKELAAVKIKAAGVDIIANELELDPKVAERTLLEHKADAFAAIRHLLR